MSVIDLFQTVDDRDSAFKSGMNEGAAESADCFAQLLQSLRATEKQVEQYQLNYLFEMAGSIHDRNRYDICNTCKSNGRTAMTYGRL
jgi:hypothetical protein